jgi:hypothetical protein
MTTHADVLKFAAASWPNPPWSPESQVLWVQGIQDIPPDAAMMAARHFFRTDPKGFRPTPGQLLARIKGDDLPAAERAWGAVLRAVAHYAGRSDYPTMPNFADPKVPQVVKAIGGFRQWANGMKSDEVEWTKSKFLKFYAAAGVEQLKLADPDAVAGLSGRGPAPAALQQILSDRLDRMMEH